MLGKGSRAWLELARSGTTFGIEGCVSTHRGARLLLCEAEVSNSDLIVLVRQEDILRLQVAMQDALSMNLVQPETQLQQIANDGCLWQRPVVLACLGWPPS